MLELTDLTSGYGRLQILRGVDLVVRQPEVVVVLGGNGVGKTTMMRTIVGQISATSGSITLNGDRIDRRAPHQIFRAGVALVPQGRELFPDMSVFENLELGGLGKGSRATVDADIDGLMTMFPRLRERARQRAGTLSGGEQQMLATGRALMSHPDLLLLDEPTAGLAPTIVGELMDVLRRLAQEGQAILLVEQNVRMAMSIAHRVYVMRGGRIVHHAAADEARDLEQMFKSFIA
jgi:branched-chain amino acid transport system ATP-binding protein